MSRNNNLTPSQLAKGLAVELFKSKWEWPSKANSYFIPIDEIENRVEETVVRIVLSGIYPRENSRRLNAAAHHICINAQRLFTVLLCASKGAYRSAILDIIEDNVTDADLPLARVYQNVSVGGRKTYTLGRQGHEYCPRSQHDNCGIMPLSSWRSSNIEELCRDQWLVLAPVFETYLDFVEHHNLDSSIVLPYIEDQESDNSLVKYGGYSEVWGVRIHPAHQRLLISRERSPLIAVKRLFSREVEEFEKENEMLSKLTLKKDPHLIKLLTTYKFKGHFHFLFPYAKLNLRMYWKENRVLEWRKREVLWILQQLLGLATALHVIHDFKTVHPLGSDYTDPQVSRQRPAMNIRMTVDEEEQKFGRHGDLKPENILWFDDLVGTGPEGIFQITDLGLGRFHRLESRSRQDPTTINGSPTYIPPELALERLVSRAYDIWSFGCIFLEFITWMLDGYSGVQKFADARLAVAHDNVKDDTFYTVYKPGPDKFATVRPEVTEWVRKLRKHRRYSKMIRDLLDLVEEMLQIETQDRIRSGELKDGLSKIIERGTRGQSSSTYLLAPVG